MCVCVWRVCAEDGGVEGVGMTEAEDGGVEGVGRTEAAVTEGCAVLGVCV